VLTGVSSLFTIMNFPPKSQIIFLMLFLLLIQNFIIYSSTLDLKDRKEAVLQVKDLQVSVIWNRCKQHAQLAIVTIEWNVSNCRSMCLKVAFYHQTLKYITTAVFSNPEHINVAYLIASNKCHRIGLIVAGCSVKTVKYDFIVHLQDC